ncbi:uncharacterized protein N7483_001516 [Penicillium malachiteum]|uniref:uncharacterized protein n=1 Tax=Penicillium malachiteum TaxID=1324776 RepID=UPI002547545E|nr:uncharacterized protein N7483_001516 [Penicillium malachiteum]KAJ5736391.1 hypothetical protein N7483_001516 [Penicillium malachiteum]
MCNECPWLLYPHIDSLDSAIESQNPCCARHIATELLVAWLHSRVEDGVWWKNFVDAFFRDVVSVSNFDETTLLGDLALVGINEYGPDTELVLRWWGLLGLSECEIHERFVISDAKGWIHFDLKHDQFFF